MTLFVISECSQDCVNCDVEGDCKECRTGFFKNIDGLCSGKTACTALHCTASTALHRPL